MYSISSGISSGHWALCDIFLQNDGKGGRWGAYLSGLGSRHGRPALRSLRPHGLGRYGLGMPVQSKPVASVKPGRAPVGAGEKSTEPGGPVAKGKGKGASGGGVSVGVFIKEIVLGHGTVGAIASSSAGLAREMVAGSGIENARCVVEYGPGVGAFTGEILARLPKGARYFAIELSPRLADRFAARFPEARLYLGSASDAPELCRQEGMNGHNCVDIVFSGLPFASFPPELQATIIERTVQILRPGGMFITFAYAGVSVCRASGRGFRRLLPKHFDKVSKGKVVWWNLPPAFVYRCVK